LPARRWRALSAGAQGCVTVHGGIVAYEYARRQQVSHRQDSAGLQDGRAHLHGPGPRARGTQNPETILTAAQRTGGQVVYSCIPGQVRTSCSAALRAVPLIKIQVGSCADGGISSAREAGADHRHVRHREIEPDRQPRRSGLPRQWTPMTGGANRSPVAASAGVRTPSRGCCFISAGTA
jgi:hypothetical protein